MIKLSKPSLDKDEMSAAIAVLSSGNLIQGHECQSFENELANYLKIDNVIVVSSGTAALHLSLIALGIGDDDAVIIPNFTFVATANVVELVGATPVFVDVEPNSYCMNLDMVESTIKNWKGEGRIKAIMPVHEFGCPVHMSTIMDFASKYELLVIEDAACALGATFNSKMLGTFGDVGCFSFHPRKVLTTGEGGAIATSNKELASKLRALKSHGLEYSKKKYMLRMPGYNYRLTDIQAAIGRRQLKKHTEKLQARNKLSRYYHSLLSNFDDMSLPARIDGHCWQTYMIVLNENINRTKLIDCMQENGIEVGIGAQCITEMDYYKKYIDQLNPNIVSRSLYNNGLALPFCEQYTEDMIFAVCDSLKKNIIKC